MQNDEASLSHTGIVFPNLLVRLVLQVVHIHHRVHISFCRNLIQCDNTDYTTRSPVASPCSAAGKLFVPSILHGRSTNSIVTHSRFKIAYPRLVTSNDLNFCNASTTVTQFVLGLSSVLHSRNVVLSAQQFAFY